MCVCVLLLVVPPRIPLVPRLIVTGLGALPRGIRVCVRVAWFFFCEGWRPHEERTTTVVDEGKKKTNSRLQRNHTYERSQRDIYSRSIAHFVPRRLV